MFNLLAKKKVKPMHVIPGDLIRLKYVRNAVDATTGERVEAMCREETLDYPIKNTAVYDTLAIGEIGNELGFKEGLVGIVGNE